MIVLDDWQKRFLDTKGDKIMCTGRQVGKTEICAMDASEWMVSDDRTGKEVVVMIAPTERQAYALFQKTLAYLTESYFKLIKQGKDRPTKTQISLKSGVKLYCLPVGASGVGIRGLTISRLYVDEASRIPEDVWTAVLPALLTTDGDCIFISTPFGTQGEFYRCWINEDSAYESFTRFSITSETVIAERPISETWSEKQREKALLKLAQAKSRMSSHEYAQEYLGEFIEDLHRFFSDAIIAKCCLLKRTEFKPQATYFLGLDLARLGDDEGTFEILRYVSKDKMVHVENIVTTKKLTTETVDKILELEKQYKFNRIGIDAGSGTLGVSILDFLMRTPIGNKVTAMNNRKLSMDKSDETKQKMLKEDLYHYLRMLMEQGRIDLLDDDEVVESLRSVQYEYVSKPGQPTKLRIFGNYTHIVEGLIRAAWCQKEKGLNLWAAWN